MQGQTLTSAPSPQNVTLAIAMFTIVASIYFFNKVSGKRAEVAVWVPVSLAPVLLSLFLSHVSVNLFLSLS